MPNESYTWNGLEAAPWDDAGNWLSDNHTGLYPGESANDDEANVTGTSPSAPATGLQIGTINGDEHFYDFMDAGNTQLQVNGTLTLPGKTGSAVHNITFNSGAALVFTDAGQLAVLIASLNNGNITAAGTLLVQADTADVDIRGSTVTVGNNLYLEAWKHNLTFNDCAFVGPGTAGATLGTIGVMGETLLGDTDNATGFEPLFKVGSGPSQSNFGGAVLVLPDPSTTLSPGAGGNTYGKAGDPLRGTLPAITMRSRPL
jgi:hypothetical protein